MAQKPTQESQQQQQNPNPAPQQQTNLQVLPIRPFPDLEPNPAAESHEEQPVGQVSDVASESAPEKPVNNRNQFLSRIPFIQRLAVQNRFPPTQYLTPSYTVLRPVNRKQN